MDQINSGLIEVAVVRTPLPTESYQCHFLEAEPMMAVGKPEFFPDPAAASISVASLASCPLIVYRRWEPFISHCFPGTAPDYLCINDDARTSMTWAQCGAGIALVPSSMARSGGEDLLKIPLSDQGVISRRTHCQKTWHGQPCIQRVFPFFPGILCKQGFQSLKSDASLLAQGIFDLETRKNMSKQPFFKEKMSGSHISSQNHQFPLP